MGKKLIIWLFVVAVLLIAILEPIRGTETPPEALLADVEYNLPPEIENALESVTEPLEVDNESQLIDDALPWNTLDVTLTAYCDCEICNGEWVGYPTASGVYPQTEHTIAVDPAVIPLGSWVVIDGNWYHAEDTGAFHGNKIDIYMDCHADALAFGRQVATIKWMEGNT